MQLWRIQTMFLDAGPRSTISRTSATRSIARRASSAAATLGSTSQIQNRPLLDSKTEFNRVGGLRTYIRNCVGVVSIGIDLSPRLASREIPDAPQLRLPETRRPAGPMAARDLRRRRAADRRARNFHRLGPADAPRLADHRHRIAGHARPGSGRRRPFAIAAARVVRDAA